MFGIFKKKKAVKKQPSTNKKHPEMKIKNTTDKAVIRKLKK